VLGRKTFTRDEIDDARKAVDAQLTALRGHDAPVLGNALLLALDRRFVHRVRPVSGKDTNPVTELELLAEGLIDHDGVLTPTKVIKYQPERTVLGLQPGEAITIDAAAFERLAEAFFTELEARFGEPA
jgi:hypothetical protein